MRAQAPKPARTPKKAKTPPQKPVVVSPSPDEKGAKAFEQHMEKGAKKKKGVETAQAETDKQLEAKAWKALKLNLKLSGYTFEQVAKLLNKKGERLISRMISDRRAVSVGDPAAPALGVGYYNDLRTEFFPASTPEKMLKSANADEEIDEELINMLEEFIGKSYTRALQFFKEKRPLTHRAIVLLVKHLIKLSPLTCPEHVIVLWSAIKYLVELDVPNKHPDTWAAFKGIADDTMLASGKEAKACQRDLTQWWDAKKFVLKHVYNVAAFDTCMGVETDFTGKEGELEIVVQTSLGRWLFGGSQQALLRYKIDNKRDGCIAELFKKDISQETTTITYLFRHTTVWK